MRVLVVTDTCYPSVGGVQTFLHGVVHGLSARGHGVSIVLAPGQTSPDPDVAVVASLPLVAPQSLREQTAMGLALAEAAIVARADVVLLATAGLAIYADALQPRWPTVVVCHGKDLTAPWQRVPELEARAAVASAVDRCRARIFVSQATRGWATSLGVVGPSVVVEPGFDLEFFTPDPSALSDRARFVIATVARLAPRKGHRLVIDAIAASSAPRVRNASYLILGDGTERADLAAHAHALGVDARVAGVASREAVRDALRCADVHVLAPTVLTSDAGDDVEGYGLSILEAAACGTPSIGARTGGVVEAIREGVSGLLVAPGDVTALTRALERIADDDALRASLALGARRRALAHGGHEATADRIEAVLESARR